MISSSEGGDNTNRKLLHKIVKSKTGRSALIEEVVRVLGVGKNTACDKLNGKRAFRSDEIEKLRIEYGLTDAEVVDCFIKEGD